MTSKLSLKDYTSQLQAEGFFPILFKPKHYQFLLSQMEDLLTKYETGGKGQATLKAIKAYRRAVELESAKVLLGVVILWTLGFSFLLHLYFVSVRFILSSLFPTYDYILSQLTGIVKIQYLIGKIGLTLVFFLFIPFLTVLGINLFERLYAWSYRVGTRRANKKLLPSKELDVLFEFYEEKRKILQDYIAELESEIKKGKEQGYVKFALHLNELNWYVLSLPHAHTSTSFLITPDGTVEFLTFSVADFSDGVDYSLLSVPLLLENGTALITGSSYITLDSQRRWRWDNGL